MSTLMAFILGLLAGWIIEWVIDWVYWRRRSSASPEQDMALRERLKAAETRNDDLERQLSAQKANLAGLQEKLSHAEADLNTAKANLELQAKGPAISANSAGVLPVDNPVVEAVPVRSVSTPLIKDDAVIRDDLEVIKGIGPVIARKLNDVGIYSFADLAATTPERLRELVGDVISRLADEESIIEQAKQLAAKKRQGG